MSFPLFRLRNILSRITFRLTLAPFLKSCGRSSVIVRPWGIEGVGNIFLGKGVFVAEAATLAAAGLAGSAQPELRIGDGCRLGRSNHIYATRQIVIEDSVLTAGNVYIADNSHSYDHPDLPIRDQPIKQLNAVRIGAGSWLGQNVCVIGASIGKGCVIGANSVVLSDIPDNCIAVGSPARVVRKYDTLSKVWIKVTKANSKSVGHITHENPLRRP